MTSREFRERLFRRASNADISLPGPIIEQLEAYYRLLARWNRKVNLTAFQLDEFSDQAVDRLLVEPLAAARFVPDSPLIWFDLGSGGGSPAVPLKLVRPETQLTMVESKTRKAVFLREVVRTLGLGQTSVENARFEELAAGAPEGGAAELITARAVKVDEKLFSVARALLREGGRLVLFRSSGSSIAPARGFRPLESVRVAGLGRASQLVALVRTLNVPRGTAQAPQSH